MQGNDAEENASVTIEYGKTGYILYELHVWISDRYREAEVCNLDDA